MSKKLGATTFGVALLWIGMSLLGQGLWSTGVLSSPDEIDTLMGSTCYSYTGTQIDICLINCGSSKKRNAITTNPNGFTLNQQECYTGSTLQCARALLNYTCNPGG